ncbi:hypothetical protein C7S10_14640 [Nocardioides currus]|uniref:Tetratricopeptide repeat protein n=1 Tax=Nocardioides currus TaxID=2133958 RepID=A0A2R7YVK8_9ACTN|nr:hypothetical protein C7S10_14640 [Nocardioides currus]
MGVAALVVALTGGCAGSDGSDEGPPAGVTESTSPDSESPDPESPDPESPDPETPAPTPGPGDVVDSEACDEVRQGIDAFNLGRYDETVEHFENAVPLAEEQDDGSEAASQLVEAVRYYADLAAGLYPEAARTSPDFAKYKAITLGQCVPVDGETSESPGVEV